MGYKSRLLDSLAETLEREPAKSMGLLEEAYSAGYSQANEDLTEELYLRAENRARVLFEEWKEGFAEGFRKGKENPSL